MSICGTLSFFTCLFPKVGGKRDQCVYMGREGYFGDWVGGLQGCRITEDTISEAKELVKEGESLYWASCDDENDNSMALGYMETPFVQFFFVGDSL